VFQAGNAAFMRNWPYAWALAQGGDSPVKGKIGVASLPKGGADGRHAATLGGQLLAVSRYAASPEAAVDLVRFLTGSQEQKRRAVEGSFNPTMPALYGDPEVVGAIPFMAELREVFANAVARPASVTGDNYNRVSTEFFNTVHRVLSDRDEPGPALKRLERSLTRIKRGDWQR
jgi:trehalose/maltose transport system substrate-binding protein